ncbi:MAG: glycosyltransferase [Thaumarchaeota archaeon]|nr:glycosyltransferase [Nitrososphaerota archaeon]
MCAMQRALLIVYNYPPRSSVGGIRSVKLAEKLIVNGWDVIVVTTTNKGDKPIRDFIKSTKEIKIIDCREFPFLPQQLPLECGLTIPLLLGDNTLGWLPSMIATCNRIISTNQIDCIYAAQSPASAFVAGAYLARRHKIPLILDYRDPWVSENPFVKLNAVHLFLLRQLERWINDSAVSIVTITKSYMELVKSADPSITSVDVIRNGFNLDQFNKIEATKFEKKTMLHMGSIYGLRNNEVGAFLKAIRHEMKNGLIDPRNFEILFVGDVSSECKMMVQVAGLADLIRIQEPVSNDKAISMIKGADYLLLFPGHVSALPAKAFEYIAARRPILNIGSKFGEAAELIESTGVGVSCNSNVKDIHDALRQLLAMNVNDIPTNVSWLERDRQLNLFLEVFQRAVKHKA